MGLQDYYITGDDTASSFSGTGPRWLAQSFTTTSAYSIASVKLKLYRDPSLAPGTITVSIRATDGAFKPTGADLASGTTDGDTLPTSFEAAEWREITFSSPYSLNSSTLYAIVVRCSGTGSYPGKWNIDTGASGYPNGSHLVSVNGGSTWTIVAFDAMFETYGASVYSEGTKTVTGEFSVILSTEEPDIYLEGVKTVTVEYSTSLSTETYSGDFLEGTKTVTASFGISLSSQQMIVDIGILTVIAAYTALLDTESLRDTINYPPSRPSDYDPDLIWDEDAGAWIAADGSAGSRLQTNLVAIGSNNIGQGVIYYG